MEFRGKKYYSYCRHGWSVINTFYPYTGDIFAKIFVILKLLVAFAKIKRFFFLCQVSLGYLTVAKGKVNGIFCPI